MYAGSRMLLGPEECLGFKGKVEPDSYHTLALGDLRPCAALAYDPLPAETTGTTLMAIEFDGGVVFGADTRTSSGSMVPNRFTDKLTRVSEHIYVCRSGSSADTQAITDIVAYHLSVIEMMERRKPTVWRAAQIFRQFCYQYREQLSAAVIVAGWDEEKGGQVYQLPSGGPVFRIKCACGGSGSTYITGFLDGTYKAGMKQDECEQFVKQAVLMAILRDGSSGGCIRLGVLTKGGMERKVFTPDTPGDFPSFPGAIKVYAEPPTM